MKAQVINQFGPPTVFESRDVAKPDLQPGHVIVKVHATSVNQIDCKIRSGAVVAMAPEFPAILGADMAGTIEAVAPDVKNFKVGDEVYGMAGGFKGTPGALAEFMLVDSRLLAIKPTAFSMLQAAAMPLVSITAWEALFSKARLTADQNILIFGGVGGVGHIAVQLAKWCGAKVFTTVLKQEDVALAKSLGADEVINAKEEDVAKRIAQLTSGKGFEVVFDTVGDIDNALQAAAIYGNVVTTVSRSTHDLTPMHNKALSLHVVFTLIPIVKDIGREEHGKILSKVAQIANQGKIKPLMDPNSFSLAQISAAHELMESGKGRGKIVVAVS